MKRSGQLPAYLALMIITLIAGFALGATYSLTEARIAEQADAAAEAARQSVMPDADAFTPQTLAEGATVDWCYEATRAGDGIGYVAQATARGFGGDIEVIAGVDLNGVITGVSVGGSDFSETAGLGAKAKDASFTDQFAGKTAPTRVVKAGEAKGGDTVDAITSATVTSRAVNGAVTTIASFIAEITGGAPIDAETGATGTRESTPSNAETGEITRAQSKPSDAETGATEETQSTPSDAETGATEEKKSTPSDAETGATEEKKSTPSDAETSATEKTGTSKTRHEGSGDTQKGGAQ